MAYKDWCPLCGRRFQANTTEELIQQIIDHIDDGLCERNFRPPDVAMRDDSYEACSKHTTAHDLPRVIAMERAEQLAREGWTVHFKFTCAHCGQRCTLRDQNTLYERGECFKCGQETVLDNVGFVILKTL